MTLNYYSYTSFSWDHCFSSSSLRYSIVYIPGAKRNLTTFFMKKIFHILVSLSIVCVSVSEVGAQFAFGLYPDMNSTKNQIQIEQKYHFTSPVVGYIFDTFEESDAIYFRGAVKTL